MILSPFHGSSCGCSPTYSKSSQQKPTYARQVVPRVVRALSSFHFPEVLRKEYEAQYFWRDVVFKGLIQDFLETSQASSCNLRQHCLDQHTTATHREWYWMNLKRTLKKFTLSSFKPGLDTSKKSGIIQTGM